MSPPYKRSRSDALVDDDLFLCANLSSLLPPQKASPRRQPSPSASQNYSSKPPLKIFPQESLQFQGSAHSSPSSSPRVDFALKQCPPASQEMNVTIHVLQGMNRFMQRFCASVDDFSLFTENPELMARLMDRFAEALVLFDQEYIASCDAAASPRSSFSLGRSNSFDSTYSQPEDVSVSVNHHTKSADYMSKLQFFLDQVLIGVMQEHVDLMLQQNVPPPVTNAPYYNAGPCLSPCLSPPHSPPCESPYSSGHASLSCSRDETDAETLPSLLPAEDLSELLEIFSEPWDAPLLG